MSERNAYTNQQQPRSSYDMYNEQSQPFTEPRFPDNRSTTINVIEAYLVPTGTYNQQWRRPWTTEYNQSNATAVHDVVARAYNDHIAAKRANTIHAEDKYMVDPNMLASVSAGFIKPAAAAEAHAHAALTHGWGEQTGRFYIKLQVQRDQAVRPTVYVLIGYTNHLAFSQHTSNIDPLMDLTINTIFELREVDINTGYGWAKEQRMERVNQVLIDPNFRSPDDEHGVIRLRPYEVAMSLARKNDPKTNHGGVELIDTRDVQNGTPYLSNQHHTNPNNYMANVLSGLVNGRDHARQTNHVGKLEDYFAAARQMKDQTAARDPFIDAITRVGGSHITNTFKWRDLMRIDGNAENRTTVQWRDMQAFANRPGENMHVRGATAEWHGQDLITQTAAQIANMVPSLMGDLALRKVYLFASNLSGQPFYSATNGLGIIESANMAPQMQGLANQFEEQVVRPSTWDGGVPYEFTVNADLFGEIHITLRIDRMGPYTYVQPAYCSSCSSPILTSTRQTLDNLATSFYNLQESVLPSQVHRPLIHDLASTSTARPSGARY